MAMAPGPIKVIRVSPPLLMPVELAIDYGLVPAEPEPTPIERALAILAPHLQGSPLSHAVGPAGPSCPSAVRTTPAVWTYALDSIK
jgi:hypothetical protein